MKTTTITVNGRNSEKLELQAAWIGESFAVTVCLNFGDGSTKYRITHMPTGATCGGVYRFKKAKAIALKLDQQREWKSMKSLPKTEKTKKKYSALFAEAISS